MDLKALPMNIIYISREISVGGDDGSAPEPMPSLKPKYYNIVNGNCDLVIHTQKFGKYTYTRTITDRRTKYEAKNITDPRIKQLLESCDGMFEK